MKYYKVYLENDGRNRRGADGSVPAKEKEGHDVWWSPESNHVVYEYRDGQNRPERIVCNLDKVGDPTFRVRFFPGEAKTITDKELFEFLGEKPKKKAVKKKVTKKQLDDAAEEVLKEFKEEQDKA